MSHQARLDFLGDDTLTADPQIIEAIIQNMSTASQIQKARDKARFILGASVSQEIRYKTLPYAVRQIYTKENNQNDSGEQNPFFIQDIGKIREIKLLESGDQIMPVNSPLWSDSSSSLGIDHECFFPTNHVDLCTKLVQSFMFELVPLSYTGSDKIVKFWLRLCAAEGNVILFRTILEDLERTTTGIYKDNSVLA